jgi:hypothetical protein
MTQFGRGKIYSIKITSLTTRMPCKSICVRSSCMAFGLKHQAGLALSVAGVQRNEVTRIEPGSLNHLPYSCHRAGGTRRSGKAPGHHLAS